MRFRYGRRGRRPSRTCGSSVGNAKRNSELCHLGVLAPFISDNFSSIGKIFSAPLRVMNLRLGGFIDS